VRFIFQDAWVRVCRCNIFGKNVEFDISLHGKNQDDFLRSFQRWQDGALIQDAFGWLNPNEREFLITGITPDHWDYLFREEDCGEEESL
jgi:hypothetical protein